MSGPRQFSHLRRRLHAPRWSVAVLFGLSVGVVTPARAEVKIEGTVAALRVTTDNDAIYDVLSKLAATFNVHYRTSVRLDTAAGARYSGSLAEVIRRLLNGYSYVIKKQQDAIEVVVVGNDAGQAIAVQSSPVSRSKTIASQWR
jgi:hypothetical protein